VLVDTLVAQHSPEVRGCLSCSGLDCVRTRFGLPSSALRKAPAAVSDTWILFMIHSCAVGRLYLNLRCVSEKSELVSV
jgi:hypothetical protein